MLSYLRMSRFFRVEYPGGRLSGVNKIIEVMLNFPSNKPGELAKFDCVTCSGLRVTGYNWNCFLFLFLRVTHNSQLGAFILVGRASAPASFRSAQRPTLLTTEGLRVEGSQVEVDPPPSLCGEVPTSSLSLGRRLEPAPHLMRG